MLLLAERLVDIVSGRQRKPTLQRARSIGGRAVEAALWLDAHAHSRRSRDDRTREAA